MSRLEMPGDRGYMVIDSAKQTMHMVMPAQHMVMDMSDTLKNAPGDDAGSGIRIDISKQGSGPRVAGYRTTRYGYTANSRNCATLFTSADAMNNAGMSEVFEMMGRLSAQADAMMSAFNQNAGPCESANPSVDPTPEGYRCANAGSGRQGRCYQRSPAYRQEGQAARQRIHHSC